MALPKNKIDVPFSQGVDTKTDPKQVQPGKLTQADNIEFKRTGEIAQRHGTSINDYEPKVVIAGVTISFPLEKCYSINSKDSDLILQAKDNCALAASVSNLHNDVKLFSFDDNNNNWIEKGKYHSLGFSSDPVSGAKINPYNVSIASWYSGGQGFRICVYDKYYTIYDIVTGVCLVPPIKFITAGNAAVVTVDDTFVLVVGQIGATGNIIAYTIDTADIYTLSAPTTIINNALGASYPWDLSYFDDVTYNDCFCVAYQHNGGGVNELTYKVFDKTLTQRRTHTEATSDNPLWVSLNWCKSSDGWANDRLVVFYKETAIANVHYTTFASNLSTVLVYHDLGYDADYVSCVPEANWTDQYGGYCATVLIDDNSYAYSGLMYRLIEDISDGTTRQAGTFYGVQSVTKPFVYDDKCYAVFCSYPYWHTRLGFEDDNYSATFYLAHWGASREIPNPYNGLFVDAVIRPTEAYRYSSFGDTSDHGPRTKFDNVFSYSPFTYQVPLFMQSYKIGYDTGVSRGELAAHVEIYSFTFEKECLQTIKDHRSMYLTGGTMRQYDSIWTYEHGFIDEPSIGLLTGNVGGGHMDDGTYSYKLVYEWVDYNGELHRSKPSFPKSITLNGGAANQYVTITAPHACVGDYTKLSNMIIHAYRTTNGGTLYYKSNEGFITNAPFSVPAAGFYDDTTDADLISNEQLYTNSGEYENDCPPSARYLAIRRNRIFLVPQDDLTTIWYSKEKEDGYAYSFSSYLKIELPDGGAITGLNVLDDFLVIFKETSIFLLSGNGPLKTGIGAGFDVRKISVDVGCVAENPTCLTNMGVFFNSAYKGIYLLDRSMQCIPIGKPVISWFESNVYNDPAKRHIVSIFVGDNKDLVYFLPGGASSTRPLLIFDLYHKQWYTWNLYYDGAGTGEEIVDACAYRDELTYLTDLGIFYKQDSQYQEGGAAFDFSFTTAWFALDQLQGCQRLYWIYIMGDNYFPTITTKTLTIELYYDYHTVVEQTITHTLGTSDISTKFQIRIKPSHQKCEALKIKITAIGSDKTKESLRFSGYRLIYGTKPKAMLKPIHSL